MKYLLNAKQSKAADSYAMEKIGIPSPVLMERASLAVTEEIVKSFDKNACILIVAGTGNNAGDGIAIGRMLYEKGYRPEILRVGDPQKYSPQLQRQLQILDWYKPVFVEKIEKKYELIVDAIFGFGLSREIQGTYAEVISEINCNGAKVIAVDIPSGIHTDTGAIMGIAVKADCTVTFTAGKAGLYLDPGRQYAGKILVREIGIPVEPVLHDFPLTGIPEEEDLQVFEKRDEAGNKGSFSKVLVIAGSEKMFGAAYLSAMAALKTGVGMVKVFTAENNRTAMATLMPEALLECYSTKAGEWVSASPEEISTKKESVAQLVDALSWADVTLIGPGLDQTEISERILYTFLLYNEKPFVMDADALNILSKYPEWWLLLKGRCIITPHMGEMSRLTGKPVVDLKKDALTEARILAAVRQVTCVMKDARTVIADPKGKAFINVHGNSALATAGSGDVLAGIITGILGQAEKRVFGENMRAETGEIAALGTFLHGLCGEKASEKYGKAAVTARNLLEYI